MTTIAFPSTIDALTPEWLTTALRAGGHLDGAAVAAVSAEPVGQGVGLLCHLARLTLDYDGDAPDAPRSLVAKVPTSEAQTRQMVALFRFYEREVSFYRDLGPRVEMNTPRCYYGAYEAAGDEFVLLLEDLAAKRLGDQLAACSLDDANVIVTELAKLHAGWWQSPRLAELEWMPAAGDPVNKAGLALYPMAWPLFMEKLGHSLPASILATGEKLGAGANDILDRFSSGPTTICHGDARMDNFFFPTRPEDPPLTTIDWQISIRAAGTYDIGYFITQSMDTEVRRAHEMDILKMYHALLTAGGVRDYSFDQMLEDYRWTVLFCFAYPVMGGGLGDLSNERGLQLATAMMNRSASAITDWDAGKLLDT